ncbi:MAG: phage tail tape measure protein [Phycisphaerales bacterium]|jgi:TP901 family phage tail tape measure protein
MSNFQISYIFQFIDKYSKVAADLHKKVGEIDKKILGSARNFENLGKRGTESFSRINKIARQSDKRMESFTRKTKKQTMAMNAMGAVVGNLKFRIASLLVTMGALGFGFAEGTRKAMDFQDVFLEMQALTGAMGKDAEFLRDQAWKLGRQFGKSGFEAMTGIKATADEFPRLLRNIPGLAKMTKEVLVLSRAAGMEVPDAVKAITAAIEIFGYEADDAKKIINMMAAGALHSSSMIEQTAEAIIRGGASASAAKIPMAAYVAMINAMAKSQWKGAKAGTAMNRMLPRLTKAGIDLSLTNKTLSETFMELRANLEALPIAMREARIDQLFTVHHRKAGLALLKHAELLDYWFKEVQNTNEAYRQADIRLKSLRVEFEKTGTVMSEKFWKFFEKIEPSLIKLTRSFRAWIDSITDEEIAGFADIISKLTDALLELAGVLAILVSPIRGFLWLMGKMELVDPLDIESKVRAFKVARGLPGAGGITEELTGLEKTEVKTVAETKGRVRVDVNLRGNTEAVESTRADVEGNIDFNMGRNFAY